MKIRIWLKIIKEGRFVTAIMDALNRRILKIGGFLIKNMKVNPRKIVFSNFYGRGYGDNPKYIAEYIINNHLNYELVWIIDDKKCKKGTSLPACIKSVPYRSLSSLKELSTACVWIDNCRKDYFPPKKENQLYIQTWHGTFLTKKIEGDANLPEDYISMAKKDSSITDYILSSNRERTNQIKRCFWFNGPILEIGCPRDDIMFDKVAKKSIKDKVCDFFKISKDNNIILYVPTFRNSHTLSPYNVDYEGVVRSLEKKFSKNWTVITRLHPGMVSFADKLNLPDFVINGTFYNDMQELLCASDVILTDYSSMGDYSLFLKPLFIYCPDLEEYKKERGFEIPLESYPFPIAHDNEELIKNIENFDEENYKMKVQEYYDQQGLLEDGNACKKVLEVIENFKKK